MHHVLNCNPHSHSHSHSQDFSLLWCRQHTQTHANTTHKHRPILALLCLQFKQSVMGECVSLLFVCSSLRVPSCLPLQNNGLAWENLSTGGLILRVRVQVFFPKYCNSDCISSITVFEVNSYFVQHYCQRVISSL